MSARKAVRWRVREALRNGEFGDEPMQSVEILTMTCTDS